jgi:hypothetical protein
MLDKNKQRIASKALVDQCCTNMGLISWELAMMLQLPFVDGNPRTFITAAGTFTAHKMLRIKEAMLPCLSTNRTFSIDLIADGLSRLEMSDEIPQSTLVEVYAIDQLDRDTNVDFPLAMTIIKAEQDKDKKIQSMLTQDKYKKHFATLSFGETAVHTLDHTNLRHPGVMRTANSIAQIFGWRGMRAQVEEHVKSCDECQRHKIVGKPSYGKLPLVPVRYILLTCKMYHLDTFELLNDQRTLVTHIA